MKENTFLPELRLKRSWAEVDLAQIRRNYRIYCDSLPYRPEVMAVVKADAYGHGDRQVSLALQKEGCNNFAVCSVEEGIRLREAGVKGTILVLGYTPAESASLLVRYDITQALISLEHAKALEATGEPILCHFALDTGMNRIGLDADDPAECERVIRSFMHSTLRITGVFSHMCVADVDTPENNAFTQLQISRFVQVTDRIRDLNLPYIHCMNSAAAMWSGHTDTLVRLGIMIYGLKPDISNTIPEGIKPALSWKTVVAMVKDLHPGETVGYGRKFKAEKEMRIATLPTGYADGYCRMFSCKGFVLIHGRKAPILGGVCMDQMMVDVTDIPNVKMGDLVVLLGTSGNESINADELADLIGTVGYEIICGISPRVPRVYHNSDESE